jgi:tetrahydromethanopterin S-methyltransferase subunit F
MMCEENRDRNEDYRYKIYIEERAKLVQSQVEETHKFDKAILTLAAGAFGFSLAFIKEIVTCIKDGTFVWLLAAWTGFGASLLSTLISFLASQSACRKQIKILEKVIFDGKKRETEKNRAAKWTFGLNIASIAAFILGVILLVVFVSMNLLH